LELRDAIISVQIARQCVLKSNGQGTEKDEKPRIDIGLKKVLFQKRTFFKKHFSSRIISRDFSRRRAKKRYKLQAALSLVNIF